MNNGNNKITLIIGGARSGKSNFAQEYASQIGGRVLFCATAEPLDGEMVARIEAHKKSRPPGWDTCEASINVGAALQKLAHKYDAVIIDCLTLLVSNCMGDGCSFEQSEHVVTEEIDRLIECLLQKNANYILVTNDVGSGLVPDNTLGRQYRDLLGRANQQLARCADEVYLMVAGLPVKIK
jgi:adenosylcobinamide kinase / adenosylcobinamide-phosphate guanylyltransferase